MGVEEENYDDQAHQPKGCNMVHPFSLRKDVDWGKEPQTFSAGKWMYIQSKVPTE